MKKRTYVIAMAAALLAAGCISAVAGIAPAQPDDGVAMAAGEPDWHPVLRLAKVLKLSAGQESQVRGILTAERDAMKPQAGRLFEARRLLQQAGEAATFDEDAVRALAAEAGSLEAEIVVSRIRVQNRIRALLSPSQLELLAAMAPAPERMPPPILRAW